MLPWAAGAVLSLLVLALTVVDERWLERVTDRSPAAPESAAVVVPPERAAPPAHAAPPAPDVATVAPEPELAPYSKSPPKIVPISPEGRGTARVEARPEPSATIPEAPAQPLAPALPDTSAPRVVPISLERPQASLSPAVQLAGAVTADDGAVGGRVEFGRPSAADAPAAADLAGVRLFIHYGAAETRDAATATRLAEYLRRRGFEVAGIRPVDFLIERPGVRFFFERDHAESERLLEDLGWFFRGQARQAPEQASDFTHYTPKPQPGTIEIWLPTTTS